MFTVGVDIATVVVVIIDEGTTVEVVDEVAAVAVVRDAFTFLGVGDFVTAGEGVVEGTSSGLVVDVEVTSVNGGEHVLTLYPVEVLADGDAVDVVVDVVIVFGVIISDGNVVVAVAVDAVILEATIGHLALSLGENSSMTIF